MKKFCMFLIMSAALASAVAYGTVPERISYQGLLRQGDGQIVDDGLYELTFRIYSEQSGGEPLWTETQTLEVTFGVFNAYLGDGAPLTPALQFDRPYWISIAIGADPEMQRVRLASAPYALRAAFADAVGQTINPPDWVHEESVTAGNSETWTHNLLGDPSDYVVIMDGREAGGYFHQANYGTNPVNSLFTHWIGAEYGEVTASTITVTRGDYDNDGSVGRQWDYIRVRIWKNQ